MKQYIEKSAIVAEIEKIYNENYKFLQSDLVASVRVLNFKYDLLLAINNLEVKDVDLEKEYKVFVEEDPVYNKLVNSIVGKAIAKHFFELGLKAQKGGEE